MKLNPLPTQSKIRNLMPYPMKFEEVPIGKIWGGRKLANWVTTPLPDDDIGEIWLLSNHINAQSVTKNGELSGITLGGIMEQSPEYILGKFANLYQSFPLLIKILNVKTNLSVQVHPSKENAKTEAWVILDATGKSRIYAGLMPNTTKEELRNLSSANIDEFIPSFTPQIGQSILLKAGTIHSMQNDLVLLEVQQNSDITFRLYDWEQIDKTTNQPRDLQIESAIKSTDFEQGIVVPLLPIIEAAYPIRRECIITCPFFLMWRIYSKFSFLIGEDNAPTILFCVKGNATITKADSNYSVSKGELILLPAALGICEFKPAGDTIIIIIKLPEPINN